MIILNLRTVGVRGIVLTESPWFRNGLQQPAVKDTLICFVPSKHPNA